MENNLQPLVVVALVVVFVLEVAMLPLLGAVAHLRGHEAADLGSHQVPPTSSPRD